MVRISHGVTPKLDHLMVIDETISMWDFNDEIDIPNHRFFNDIEAAILHSLDGPDTNDGLFDEPLVFMGYDFANFQSSTSAMVWNI